MKLYELKNDNICVVISNVGCRIVSIFCKDKEGKMDDVVLNIGNLEKDLDKDSAHFGDVIGRVANRIKDGKFTLNGVEYQLAINNGTNCLHGGLVGFDKKIYDVEEIENGLVMSTVSADGEENFPGKLDFKVTYKLEGTTLSIEYEAVSDKDTIVNFTNHSYFNLKGKKSSILDHKLMIKANEIAQLDESCAVTGKMLSVKNTPFDFNEFHTIGERIDDEDEQLRIGSGYDHCFILSEKENQIVLMDDATGRVVTVSTDMPTAQIYTGNFLKGNPVGKNGWIFDNREGVAIETQFLPNSINVEENPTVFLGKGEHFYSKTSYNFTVK